MSEETECRLTYREGREIAEKAMRPYSLAMLMAFLTGMIVMCMCGIVIVTDSLYGMLNYGDIDALLREGEISEAVADYLKMSRRESILDLGVEGLIGGSAAAMGFASLGEAMRKRALKEANEEKAP